ncbi:SLBB domain-containing protein [Xanthomonas campestris pv. phormiicola]|nr:SLBB domain-containing protein [Xanthomonas campestris pv. phormiicola]UYC16027.1 SLBB domain-containing protein [Xanthomonas campestris pv. phormiicola]
MRFSASAFFRPGLSRRRSRLRCAVAALGALLSSGCALLPAAHLDLDPAQAVGADGAPSELRQNGIAFRLHRLDGGAAPALFQAPADAAVAATPMPPAAAPAPYLVRSGDTLRVIVWDHPELNNPGLSALSTGTTSTAGAEAATAPKINAGGNLDPQGRLVQPDGTIYFPYVGRVKVAGQDIGHIRDLLARRLDPVIPSPQLDVAVVAFRSQKVYVSGAVRDPGALALTDVPMTVADAIAGAGGYTTGADLESATLNRDGRPQPLDLYAFFYRGDLAQNLRLRDGDVLNLPERRLKKVFVLGEVAKPGSQVMPLGPFTLSEALADAGGLNLVSANASQIYVFRHAADGHVDAYQLDTGNPGMLALGDQFALHPRDIVFVDPAKVTRFSRAISQILPLASLLYLGSAAISQ